MVHTLFVLVDLLGTFAFAMSGAAAAKDRRLDLFGVYAVSFLPACGGGILRHVCLGALPPKRRAELPEAYAAPTATARGKLCQSLLYRTPWPR